MPKAPLPLSVAQTAVEIGVGLFGLLGCLSSGHTDNFEELYGDTDPAIFDDEPSFSPRQRSGMDRRYRR
jgi:hypothetical protein